MHDLIIHNYGPGRSMISLHVEVPANISMVDAHDTVDNIERKLKEVLNCECIIHMDPIAMNDSVTARMREFVSIIVNDVDPSLSVHDFRMVQGSTHTNLIFDLVIPHGLSLSDEEIVDMVEQKVQELPGNHYAMITVDKPYV